MKTNKIYRTWGRPFGTGSLIVCEISASSKREAIQKWENNRVVVEDKKTHLETV